MFFIKLISLFSVLGKRGADGRLSSAQTALMLQEETIRKLERERKSLNEKMLVLETSLAQAEADRRALKDKVSKLQHSEARSDQEKEAMRAQIENAESRLTRMDLKKRALEGNRPLRKVTDQDRSDFYVVFTIILCGINFCVWQELKLRFTS